MNERWSTERRWPDGTNGPLVLRLTLALVHERPEVVGVELWAVAPPDPADTSDQLFLQPDPDAAIHTEDLRLPLRRLLDEWKASVRSAATFAEHSPGAKLLGEQFRSAATETARVVEGKRKGGHDVHSPEHWQRVADVYLRAGTKGVASTWGIAPGTAAKWVWVARNEKGLLDPTAPGRRSGRSGRKPERSRQRKGN